MNKIKAVIVDDEKIAREVLEGYLTSYCEQQIEIIALCDGFDSAVSTLRKEDVDLVFLDVEMPFGNGLDVLESLGNYDFKVIFTTAFDQYALDALNKHAFDYLLKPISIKKLMKAVDDVHQLLEKENNQPIESKSTNGLFLKIPSSNGFELVKKSDVVFVKASDNYSEITLLDKSLFIVSKTLKKVETELNSSEFIRVHKSYLVNVNYIKGFDRNLGGQLKLIHDFEVPISSTGKKLLNAFI